MTDDKNEWLQDQIQRFGVPEELQDPMTRLVKIGWFLRQNHGLDQATYEKFLKTVMALSQEHNIAHADPESVWIQAKPGMLVVRDYVRVKDDAYTGETGLMHNGKTGVITAIRYGDIHVLYEDSTGASTVRHSPHALEKKVR